MSLGVAAAFAVLTPAPEAQAGDKVDCSKLNDIKAFCDAQGGKPAAIKKVMKKAEKAYEKAGKGEISCKSCHTDGNGTELNKAESDKLWPEFKPFVQAAIKDFKGGSDKDD